MRPLKHRWLILALLLFITTVSLSIASLSTHSVRIPYDNLNLLLITEGGCLGVAVLEGVQNELEELVAQRSAQKSFFTFLSDEWFAGEYRRVHVLTKADRRTTIFYRVTYAYCPSIITLGVAFIILSYALIAGPYRRYSRKKRNACPECGYSLIGNPSDRCPESGTTVSPTTPTTPSTV